MQKIINPCTWSWSTEPVGSCSFIFHGYARASKLVNTPFAPNLRQLIWSGGSNNLKKYNRTNWYVTINHLVLVRLREQLIRTREEISITEYRYIYLYITTHSCVARHFANCFPCVCYIVAKYYRAIL